MEACLADYGASFCSPSHFICPHCTRLQDRCEVLGKRQSTWYVSDRPSTQSSGADSQTNRSHSVCSLPSLQVSWFASSRTLAMPLVSENRYSLHYPVLISGREGRTMGSRQIRPSRPSSPPDPIWPGRVCARRPADSGRPNRHGRRGRGGTCWFSRGPDREDGVVEWSEWACGGRWLFQGDRLGCLGHGGRKGRVLADVQRQCCE